MVAQALDLPNPVQLVVVREAGVFGEVRIIWNISNNHYNGIMNIAPSSGEVSKGKRDTQLFQKLSVCVFCGHTCTWQRTTQQVVFLNGSSMATITLYIQPDRTPELSATFPVTLRSITQNGLPPGGDPVRGAHLLPGRSVVYVTIPPHNDPYGVIVWSPSAVNVSQSDVAQSVAVLSIVRLAGTIGTVQIQYRYVLIAL